MSTPNMITNIWVETATQQFEDYYPCLAGRHRWAWLVSGGQACGLCGVPRV